MKNDIEKYRIAGEVCRTSGFYDVAEFFEERVESLERLNKINKFLDLAAEWAARAEENEDCSEAEEMCMVLIKHGALDLSIRFPWDDWKYAPDNTLLRSAAGQDFFKKNGKLYSSDEAFLPVGDQPGPFRTVD